MAETTTQEYISVNEFNSKDLKAYKLSQKKDYKKVDLQDNDNRVYLMTGEYKVLFPKYDEKYGFSFSLEIPQEGNEDVLDILGEKLNESMYNLCIENREEWFGDDDLDREQLVANDYLKPSTQLIHMENKIFKPNLGSFKVPLKGGVQFNDASGNEIENPNPRELLPNKIVKIVFSIPNLIIKSNSFKPSLKLHAVQIIKDVPVEDELILDNYNSSLLAISSKVIKNNFGGKKTMIYYDGHAFGFYLTNVRPSGFKFQNVNPKDGSISYSFNIRMDETFINAIKTVEDDIINLLVSNSKDLFDKKKNEKTVRKAFRSLLCYSKADQEKIKAGNTPQYNPTFKVVFPFYTPRPEEGKELSEEELKGNFGTKIIGLDGEEYTDDLIEYVSSGNEETKCDFSKSYNMFVYCKHVWFGDKTSVRFDCGRLEFCEGQSEPQVKFNFGNVPDADLNRSSNQTNDTTEENTNNVSDSSDDNNDDDGSSSESSSDDESD